MKTEKFARECVEKINAVWKRFPWESKECYADCMAQTYYYVSHATRVLSRAASLCKLAEEPFHKFLLKGINEEKNHELLALNDIKELGFTLEDFPERSETTAYYLSLYSLIESEGPYALLGYFIPLEGVGAVGGSYIYEKIVRTHGRKAESFVRVHAKADVAHFEDGLKALKSLNQTQLIAAEKSLKLSTDLYCNILERIMERISLAKKAA